MAISIYSGDDEEDEDFNLEELSDDEIAELRRKIQAGIDDLRQGRYVTLRTKEDIDAFTERIIRQAEERRNNRL